MTPDGLSARIRCTGKEVLLQQDRLFKRRDTSKLSSLSQSPLATAKFYFHFIQGFFSVLFGVFFFLPFFLFSKSGIRMEAGGIPWELRTIAENTKKCSEGPSICQPHVIYSKECHTGYVSWWEDSKQTDKLRMLSTHSKRFGNGNNESYSPKYFILHLK